MTLSSTRCVLFYPVLYSLLYARVIRLHLLTILPVYPLSYKNPFIVCFYLLMRPLVKYLIHSCFPLLYNYQMGWALVFFPFLLSIFLFSSVYSTSAFKLFFIVVSCLRFANTSVT